MVNLEGQNCILFYLSSSSIFSTLPPHTKNSRPVRRRFHILLPSGVLCLEEKENGYFRRRFDFLLPSGVLQFERKPILPRENTSSPSKMVFFFLIETFRFSTIRTIQNPESWMRFAIQNHKLNRFGSIRMVGYVSRIIRF